VSYSFIFTVISTIIIVELARRKIIVNWFLEVNSFQFRLYQGKWENVIY